MYEKNIQNYSMEKVNVIDWPTPSFVLFSGESTEEGLGCYRHICFIHIINTQAEHKHPYLWKVSVHISPTSHPSADPQFSLPHSISIPFQEPKAFCSLSLSSSFS